MLRILCLGIALGIAGCASAPTEMDLQNQKTADACAAAGEKFRIENPKGPTHVKPLWAVEPKFPSDAKFNGVEGCVGLAYDLNGSGEPVNIRVVVAEPADDKFRESALYAFAQWRFPKAEAKNQTVLIKYKVR